MATQEIDPRVNDPTCKPASPVDGQSGVWNWKCDDGYTFRAPYTPPAPEPPTPSPTPPKAS